MPLSINRFFVCTCIVLHGLGLSAQESLDNVQLDSLFISEIEHRREPDKVLHAEPLYIDLIRDLGARRGEAEWNAAIELADQFTADRYSALIEYEWAPIDRLGLEIELPFTLYPQARTLAADLESGFRVESLKLAAQWTFLVDQSRALSMALGYINELEFGSLRSMQRDRIVRGNVFNPFVVVAKRWGEYFHSLLYAGPRINYHFASQHATSEMHANLSFHYMITGTRNFVGLETNARFGEYRQVVFRPQMRVGLAENVLVGIGVGIPVDRGQERLSMFLRLIWEPHL
jgi:hypothetical protein